MRHQAPGYTLLQVIQHRVCSICSRLPRRRSVCFLERCMQRLVVPVGLHCLSLPHTVQALGEPADLVCSRMGP